MGNVTCEVSAVLIFVVLCLSKVCSRASAVVRPMTWIRDSRTQTSISCQMGVLGMLYSNRNCVSVLEPSRLQAMVGRTTLPEGSKKTSNGVPWLMDVSHMAACFLCESLCVCYLLVRLGMTLIHCDLILTACIGRGLVS